MKTLEEIFHEEGVTLRHDKDQYYCTCPHCSPTRRAQNRKKPVLKVRIDGRGVRFSCMHCAFHTARFFDEGEPNDRKRNPERQARKAAPGKARNIAGNGGKTWDHLARRDRGVSVPPTRSVAVHEVPSAAKAVLDRTLGRRVVAVESGLLPGFNFNWRNAHHNGG